jgi:hypothetical protein
MTPSTRGVIHARTQARRARTRHLNGQKIFTLVAACSMISNLSGFAAEKARETAKKESRLVLSLSCL